jgi:hypothetical protein
MDVEEGRRRRRINDIQLIPPWTVKKVSSLTMSSFSSLSSHHLFLYRFKSHTHAIRTFLPPLDSCFIHMIFRVTHVPVRESMYMSKHKSRDEIGLAWVRRGGEQNETWKKFATAAAAAKAQCVLKWVGTVIWFQFTHSQHINYRTLCLPPSLSFWQIKGVVLILKKRENLGFRIYWASTPCFTLNKFFSCSLLLPIVFWKWLKS